MRRRAPAICLLALSVSGVLSACGPGESIAATTTSPATSVQSEATTTAPTVPTTGGPTTTEPAATTVPDTTTTVPPIDYEITAGEVVGPATQAVALGETVSITIVSDVDDEIHVHGYDLYFELTAGVPQTLQFVADVPGLFEVEVHTGHTPVFDLEVTG